MILIMMLFMIVLGSELRLLRMIVGNVRSATLFSDGLIEFGKLLRKMLLIIVMLSVIVYVSVCMCWIGMLMVSVVFWLDVVVCIVRL